MSTTPDASAKAISTDVKQALLVILLLAIWTTARSQSNTSVYTSLEEKHCRPIKSASADYEGRCRGIAGYALLLSEGDLRQNVTVVTARGTKHSLDLWDVVSGGFSSVGPKAEWRMSRQNGKLAPVALILRYNANEDPAQPNKRSSYLAVTKITPTEICVTDKIPSGPKANEDARHAADNATTKPCLKH